MSQQKRTRPPKPCGPTIVDVVPAELRPQLAFQLNQAQRAIDAADVQRDALRAAAVAASEPEAFFDRHALAKRWKCSADTVDRTLRRESDALRVILVGGKPLVRRDALERWEDDHAPAAFTRRR